MSVNSLSSNFRQDFSASIIVFFVAVPLCLGIALASGAPLFAGIIAGIVGGIVVGAASGSQLGVSGPAAGLTVIVLNAIATLGSWEAFLFAVVIAGIIQLIMGFLKLGTIAYYFPSSVIKGMLTGIGLIIILKQIPHALGYDKDYEGDLAFISPEGKNTFSQLLETLNYISPAALTVTVISMTLLLLWENVLQKKHKIFRVLQGPIVVVIVGIMLNMLFKSGIFAWQFEPDQIVSLPIADSIASFFGQFTLPDFSQFANPDIYYVAFVLAVIASLETLLCVEATDKLDPYKRVTPTNKELKAQGLGNMLSGLIGGLPVTQVIVRSSANITFGGRTKLSAIMHGVLLLFCVVAIPNVLNMIPLATLACILFVVGYKLAKPSLFRAMFRLGWNQFIPFMATVVGILLTDLLKGIGIGMVVGIIYILRSHFKNAYALINEEGNGMEKKRMILAEEVSFLNKGSIIAELNNIKHNTYITIDASNTKTIDHDVVEVIRDFIINSKNKNIQVEILGINELGKQITNKPDTAASKKEKHTVDEI